MTAASLNANPVLVHAMRGGIVESAHRGAVAIVDADGTVHTALGDIDRPIFARSAIKVLQALPLVESGAADVFGLSNEELALACASHGGEPMHVATVTSMLAKAGLDADALECGVHWPYHDGSLKALAAAGKAPSALHNNCSGKHAGFVCLGCMLAGRNDADARRGFVAGYIQPQHPVMREVGDAIQATTGWDLTSTAVGTDGCSIPTYAIPLRHLALAFARVATGAGLRDGHAKAARRLRQAVAKAPQMVAGSGRFDSTVMALLGERVFCKVGAEGVHCAALPELGLGVAIKVDDGNTARACEVAQAAVIQALLKPLSGEERARLAALSDIALVNWNGVEVGRLQAAPALHDLG